MPDVVSHPFTVHRTANSLQAPACCVQNAGDSFQHITTANVAAIGVEYEQFMPERDSLPVHKCYG